MIYLIYQLANTISKVRVKYKDRGIVLEEVFTIPNYRERL